MWTGFLEIALIRPSELARAKESVFLGGSRSPIAPRWYRTIKKISTWIVSWLAALAIAILRLTCRVRLHDDPRPELRRAGRSYIYAVLHAHQVAAIVDCEKGTGAMVSRSDDGQLIVPALRLRGVVPVRGSGRRLGQEKGGRAALGALIAHVDGGAPAYLAVDGPRGPRGEVHKGIAVLARETGAVVITLAVVPSRRWTLRSWDRLQIPRPFAQIDGYFGPPLEFHADENAEAFCTRIAEALYALESRHDPAEARYNVRARLAA